MEELLKVHFKNLGKPLLARITDLTSAIMRCGKVNTSEIARQMSAATGKSFKTSDMAVFRLLRNKKFEVGDSTFRGLIRIIFELSEKSGEISKSFPVQINIDFTSHTDKYLILSASTIMRGKAVTIFFSVRRYPKRRGRMSQTKMEEAFIKGLRHVLPKKYEYVVVADRGFGNGRFAQLCSESGFGFVLRVKRDLNIIRDGATVNLKTIEEDGEFIARIKAWDREVRLSVCSEGESRWHLVGGGTNVNLKTYYEKRFKIEKNYQDCKSSGYDIEKSKLEKCQSFKRLLFCAVLAHALTCYVGCLIMNSSSGLKKNSPEKESPDLSLISVFLRPGTTLSQFISGKPSGFLGEVADLPE